MSSPQHYDAVIIGTGFGGSFTALELARAGKSVVMLDRGRWADRDDSDWDTRAVLIDRKYQGSTPYEAPQFPRRKLMYSNEIVGGNSVIYGGASFRLREADFERRSRFEHVYDQPPGFVDWPIRYGDLEPFYEEAEQMLSVAGRAGTDPTEPHRNGEYPAAPIPYGGPSRHLAGAALRLGLRPFQIPLAINYENGTSGRSACQQCSTCDLFPCKIGAKNDLSVTIIPQAQALGAEVRGRTTVTSIERDGNRVRGVSAVNMDTGETFQVHADTVVLSAGAIASPKLLLASGLGGLDPNGGLIGRYLMRHCSGVAIGMFRFPTNPDQAFHKQVAITDFYYGHPSDSRGPAGPWGMIQGLQTPPAEYIELGAPFPINRIGASTTKHQMYMLTIAEDVPTVTNRVQLHQTKRDPYGAPIADLRHVYAKRDKQGRAALQREAARILKEAGAWLRLWKPIYTFSHAAGTCRFGEDPRTSVLDPFCRVHGMENLFVMDGSFMPTSGGVNPSLTIAANAIRVGRHMVDTWEDVAP